MKSHEQLEECIEALERHGKTNLRHYTTHDEDTVIFTLQGMKPTQVKKFEKNLKSNYPGLVVVMKQTTETKSVPGKITATYAVQVKTPFRIFTSWFARAEIHMTRNMCHWPEALTFFTLFGIACFVCFGGALLAMLLLYGVGLW